MKNNTERIFLNSIKNATSIDAMLEIGCDYLDIIKLCDKFLNKKLIIKCKNRYMLTERGTLYLNELDKKIPPNFRIEEIKNIRIEKISSMEI